MSCTYCHTHSKYDCQTCADEILSLGIQVDKDRIKWLESEVARLEACAAELATLREKAAEADDLRKDVELGECIRVKFRLMKGSTAVRFLGCLGVNEPEGGFDWSKTVLELIDAAIAQDKGE